MTLWNDNHETSNNNRHLKSRMKCHWKSHKIFHIGGFYYKAQKAKSNCAKNNNETSPNFLAHYYSGLCIQNEEYLHRDAYLTSPWPPYTMTWSYDYQIISNYWFLPDLLHFLCFSIDHRVQEENIGWSLNLEWYFLWTTGEFYMVDLHSMVVEKSVVATCPEMTGWAGRGV